MRWGSSFALAVLGFLGSMGGSATSSAQEHVPVPAAWLGAPATSPIPFNAPTPAASDRPLPINLPTALQLANVRPIDIALASQRIEIANAQLQRARAMWLPTLYLGVDYARHDGQIQNIEGKILTTSRSSFMVGAGPSLAFAITDALFGPLAARQVVQARDAELQAARNDSLLAVAEAYFNVQQAVGELAGAEAVVQRAEDLLRRAGKLAPALVPQVEEVRVRTELARRRQTVHTARERWRSASAELTRVLRMEAAALVQPLEEPHLRVTLIPVDRPVDDLIALGLTSRPELAARQALVQLTLQRLRQERLRPLIPSVLIRGNATNPGGTLSGGSFGGGLNDDVSNFGARHSVDVQALWELQNLGFGNRALVRERQAENELAALELFRTQDRVAAEVAQTHAQVRSATDRVADAESELKNAAESVERNFEGLGQTKRAGDLIVLVIRPQEAVAAVQALAQAYNDYYGTVADYNRAQFRLYRAMGHPAQALIGDKECHR